MKTNHRDKAEWLARKPYTVEVFRDETTEGQPVYIAQTPELEGCIGQGISVDKAVANLSEARVDYIESLLEDGLPVPEPILSATTTGTTAFFTLNLHYKQKETAVIGDREAVVGHSEKQKRLYEGAMRI